MKLALRVAQVVGLIVAVVLLLRAGYGAWGELRAQPVSADPVRMIAATFWLAGALFLPIELWRRFLQAFGHRIPYAAAMQLWSFANLGRYLPGKVWQVLATVVVARRYGVPPGTAASVAFLAIGLQIGSGCLISLVLFRDLLAMGPWIAFAVVALTVVLLLPVAVPGILGQVIRRLPASLGLQPPLEFNYRHSLPILVGLLLMWITQGMGFWLWASAFGPVAPGEVAHWTAAYALAYVTGLLAFFAPGGIGVREEVLVQTLSALEVGDLPLHVVVVSARLWSTAGELVVLLVTIGLALGSRRVDDA